MPATIYHVSVEATITITPVPPPVPAPWEEASWDRPPPSWVGSPQVRPVPPAVYREEEALAFALPRDYDQWDRSLFAARSAVRQPYPSASGAFYPEEVLAVAGGPVTVDLVEPLGLLHETQLVQLTTTAALGFTPSSITLGGIGQTFQTGNDGAVLVLTALSPYETKTYTLTP